MTLQQTLRALHRASENELDDLLHTLTSTVRDAMPFASVHATGGGLHVYLEGDDVADMVGEIARRLRLPDPEVSIWTCSPLTFSAWSRTARTSGVWEGAVIEVIGTEHRAAGPDTVAAVLPTPELDPEATTELALPTAVSTPGVDLSKAVAS